MPNYIENKITLIGNENSIKQLVEKFSTHYPETEYKTYDGRNICKGKKGELGWYDKETTVFERRDLPSVLGLPEDFEFEMVKAWDRFPDFEKVFPVPQSIKAVGDSVNSKIIDAVYAKYNKPFDTNPLLVYLQAGNRLKGFDIAPEEEQQFELACKAYEETGFAYWYDFQNAKWGTKWNAFECKKEADNVFTFETAWSGVPHIIAEISKSFDGTIDYKFADEDTGYNVGSFIISNGEIIEDKTPEKATKEAYDIAFELRPSNKDYYNLVDGNYKYKDDDED